MDSRHTRIKRSGEHALFAFSPCGKFQVPNTGDLVPVAGNQVYVEFQHFKEGKYPAVDWFILTIFAPNGFYDWEVASKDLKEMLAGKEAWRITASKASVASEDPLEMLANIKEKMDATSLDQTAFWGMTSVLAHKTIWTARSAGRARTRSEDGADGADGAYGADGADGAPATNCAISKQLRKRCMVLGQRCHYTMKSACTV